MDLKTFGEEDFDPKKWINRAWSTNANQEKEVFVANAVSRLQLYMKQLTNSLDETTTQIVSCMGRVSRDAGALQADGAALRERLVALEDKVRGVEDTTGHSILSLQRIDELKSRLEGAACKLREADKWVVLITALEEALEAGAVTQLDKVPGLAEQASALTVSAALLGDGPEAERKRLQLETLYNRLEAALAAPLLDALAHHDAERSRTYLGLAEGMGRGAAGRRCWRQAAGAALAAAWRHHHTHSLAALAALRAAREEEHLDWLTNVLKVETPRAELMALYTDVLLSLEPSPTKVVSAGLKLCSRAEDGLLLLLDARRDIDDLVAGLRPPGIKEEIPAGVVREFGRAAYGPLRAHVAHYADLQAQLLRAHLHDARIDEQETLLEKARAVLHAAECSSRWLQAARARARHLAARAAPALTAPAAESLASALHMHISGLARAAEREPHSRGVLAPAFPVALLLDAAAERTLEALRETDAPDAHDTDEVDPSDPLSDMVSLLLDSGSRVEPETEPPSAAALRRDRDQLRALAKLVLCCPVDTQLDKIPVLGVWSGNSALSADLPDFALSPQEYITEVGQYLLTLPQHLELHAERRAPLHFLNEVMQHTCGGVAERVLRVRELDALGARRAHTDIQYVCSVVEELGGTVPPALTALQEQLKTITK